MTDRAFVDTNVFVYAVDDGEPEKRDRARELISGDERTLVISAQVIGEFYVVATRKLASPLSASDAADRVSELLRLPVVPVDAELAGAAVATSSAEQLSYWDALIVEAAAVAGCDTLITEDLNEGQAIRSVVVENPFAAGSAG